MYYIYEITNNLNGKTYIGQRKCPSTKTPETDSYMGSGVHIRAAIKKYGKENFSKKILFANVETKEEIDELEKWYIAEARKNGKAEYNIADGGDCGPDRSGAHHSPETKEKMREAKIGKVNVCVNTVWVNDGKISTRIPKDSPIPEGFVRGMKPSASKKGKIWITKGTENRCISADKPIPEGWVRGMKPSDAKKGKPGHPHSEEHKAKIGETARKNRQQCAYEYCHNNPSGLTWNEFQKEYNKRSKQQTA